MNAPLRSFAPNLAPNPDAFAQVEDLCAIFGAEAEPEAALAKMLALLARNDLGAGRIYIAAPDKSLKILAALDDAPAPEAAPLILRRVLKAEASVALRVADITPAGKRKRVEKTILLAVPLRRGDENFGVLTVWPRDFYTADRALLALAANLIAPLAGNFGFHAEAAPGAKTIIGASPALRDALDKARKFSKVELPVLLRGESGAGKELFAQYIHDHSGRASKAFVKINCAALSEGVLESELFGHERGAFTGAESRRKGLFERAEGGTLLLDEIGEISPNFQAKLLRVLQEGEFERVGGEATVKVDVRIIAATQRHLEILVRRGKFRPDLYYRLAVALVDIPSLKERREDIPLLARHIVARFSAENGVTRRLDPGAIELISRCAFPGNVRELENCLRGACAMAEDDTIVERDFACRSRGCFTARLRRARAALP